MHHLTKLLSVLTLTATACVAQSDGSLEIDTPDDASGAVRQYVDNAPWGPAYAMHQGELITGATQVMKLSGQVALNDEGEPLYPGDMAKQMQHALDSIQEILELGGMTFADVVHLSFYVTSTADALEAYPVYMEFAKAHGVEPTQSMIGVNELVAPGLVIEIEATAMR